MKHAGKVFAVLIALCVLSFIMTIRAATAHADALIMEPFVIYCASEKTLHKTMPGEVRALKGSNGVNNKFGTTEVWIDKTNLNWSIIYRCPSGKTCLIATGKDLRPTIEGDPA